MIPTRDLLVGMTCLLLILASCSSGEVYYRFHHLDKGRWYRENPLVFAIDSMAFHPGKQFDLSIELSTNQGYPYRDLWLRVDHNLADTLFRSDSLHIQLADEQGRWLGSGAGGLNQLSVPYLDRVVPQVHDSVTGYRVKIGHLMKDNPLHGVESVGLRIVEK